MTQYDDSIPPQGRLMNPRPALTGELRARFRRLVRIAHACIVLSWSVMADTRVDLRAPPAPVAVQSPLVDAPRLVGSWFLVAKVPQAGDSDDVDSYVELTARKAGVFDEIEHGFDHRLLQSVVLLRGHYEAVSDSQFTRWIRSSRIDPGRSELLLLYVDGNYRCLVFAEPRSKLVWIYSRTPDIGPAVYSDVATQLEQQRYDTHRLHRVAHAVLANNQGASLSPGQSTWRCSSGTYC